MESDLYIEDSSFIKQVIKISSKNTLLSQRCSTLTKGNELYKILDGNVTQRKLEVNKLESSRQESRNSYECASSVDLIYVISISLLKKTTTYSLLKNSNKEKGTLGKCF